MRAAGTNPTPARQQTFEAPWTGQCGDYIPRSPSTMGVHRNGQLLRSVLGKGRDGDDENAIRSYIRLFQGLISSLLNFLAQ